MEVEEVYMGGDTRAQTAMTGDAGLLSPVPLSSCGMCISSDTVRMDVSRTTSRVILMCMIRCEFAVTAYGNVHDLSTLGAKERRGRT